MFAWEAGEGLQGAAGVKLLSGQVCAPARHCGLSALFLSSSNVHTSVFHAVLVLSAGCHLPGLRSSHCPLLLLAGLPPLAGSRCRVQEGSSGARLARVLGAVGFQSSYLNSL